MAVNHNHVRAACSLVAQLPEDVADASEILRIAMQILLNAESPAWLARSTRIAGMALPAIAEPDVTAILLGFPGKASLA